jgi:hypothetical protein
MHTLDLDHTEPELEIQRSKSVRCGGPQASSSKNTNIVVVKASLGVSHHHPWLLFWIYIFMLRMIVHYVDRSYWNRSYIMNTFWVTLDDLASLYVKNDCALDW